MFNCVRKCVLVAGVLSAVTMVVGRGDQQTAAKKQTVVSSETKAQRTTVKTPVLPQKTAVQKSDANAKDKPVKSEQETALPMPQKAQEEAVTPKPEVTYAPPSRAQLIGSWRCVTKQPLMTLKTNETFMTDQLVKSEGNIAFQIPEGPTLNIFVDSESRWNLRDSTLCDVPLKMELTQTSGEQNVHIDNLLKSMRGQVEARISGKLATCRTIISLDEKKLVLRVPQKNVDTKCVRKED